MVMDLIQNIRAKKGEVSNRNFDDFFDHLKREAKSRENLTDPENLNIKIFF